MERKEWWNRRCIRQSQPVHAAFLGAIIWGLVSQGMGLFNKFSSNDDIFQLFHIGSTITSGRWMLFLLEQAENLLFGGHCSLPLLNGSFAIFCICLSAGLLTFMLRIRRPLLSALLGAFMVSFPTVTSLFGFMFTVHAYMLAMLMMTASAYLICRPLWRAKGVGIVLGACAVGIYQAFLPILLSVVLLYDILDLTDNKKSLSSILSSFLAQGICIVAVMGLYTAVNRLFLWKYALSLDSYMGISEAASTSPLIYLKRVSRAYQEFFLPSRQVSWDMYPQRAHSFYILMLCTEGLMSVLLIRRTWQGSRGHGVLLALLMLLFPLGCNFIFVMSEQVHSLMVYAQVIQAVLFVSLFDRMEYSISLARKAFSLCLILLLSGMCVIYARFDNQCYLKAEFQQQEAISWNTELIARVKSTKGYRDDLPIAWVNRYDLKDRTLYNMAELSFLRLATYDYNMSEYISNYAWERFLAAWCGFKPDTVNPESVSSWPDVQSMPSYPADGSIQVISDVVIVKF